MTKVEVAEELTITRCDPTVTVQPVVTVTATAVAGDEKRWLRGGDWTSWTKSRDVSVGLYDSGAIKAVSSTSSDRTFAVVTNVLKGLTSLKGLGTGTPSDLTCTDEAKAALKQVAALEARIATLRAQLASAPPAQAAQLVEAINGLAAEAARLKTSKPLNLSLKAKPVDLTKGGGRIVWQDSDVNESLSAADAKPAEHLALAYCLGVATSADPEAACDIATATTGAGVKMPAVTSPTACPGDTACERTVVFRQPKTALLTVVAGAQGYGSKMDQKLKALTLPVAQWGDYSFLSLDVGLAQSRTVGLTLDEYGRTTSLAWKSDARAESITGGVAGVADAAAAYRKAEAGQALAERNAAIADLESQQKYNKLKLCAEIIRSGGFTCPES